VRLNYWLRSLFAVPPKRRTRTAAAAVEALEDRTLLTTFTVNTTADTVDADPGDGVAEDSNGETSLRAAVMEADGLAGQEVDIVLPGGTYVLGGALHFNSGTNVRLVGESAATSIIDGGGVDRVIFVHTNSVIELSHLSVQNGVSYSGGGILNQGSLGLSFVHVTGNEVIEPGGGATISRVFLRDREPVRNRRLHCNKALSHTLDLTSIVYLSCEVAKCKVNVLLYHKVQVVIR
jgi:hypothetical protein